MTFLRKFRRDDRGLTSIEYALITAACTVTFAGAMSTLSDNLEGQVVIVNGTLDLDAFTGGGGDDDGSSGGGDAGGGGSGGGDGGGSGGGGRGGHGGWGGGGWGGGWGGHH